jgi:calcineurin-like phosphoesterase family protein
MNRFATSDEHFGHHNILTGWDGKQTPRPFANMEDMVEGIIDRHNAVVGEGDEVYHLGDMFWRTFGEMKSVWVMSRLNGTHFYVLGNHDEIVKESHLGLTAKFESISERLFLKDKLNKHGIVLDHYSGRVWNGSHKGSWQLYGHSHGNLENRFDRDDLLSMDVGVDVNNFTPVAFEDIAVKMRKRVERREKTFAHLAKQERSYNSITS